MPQPRQTAVELQSTVNNLLINSVSKSTRKAYETGIRIFIKFLLLQGLAFDCSKLPVTSEDKIVEFVAYCFEQLKLKFTTIKLYLCGIRYGYMIHGVASPFDNMPLQRLHAALMGIKRLQGLHRSPKMPITTDILFKLCQCLDSGYFDNFTNILMKTVLLLAFFGFLRCGEFAVSTTFQHDVNMTFDDVRIFDDHLTIHLKQSKTDPFRKGITLMIFKTGSSLCPYQAVVKYISLRNSSLPSLIRHTDPFFVTSYGKPLSRAFFVGNLKLLISSIGLDSSKFAGHSVRRGSASVCALHRIEDHVIQKLGRWSSNCYQRYIEHQNL